MFDLINVYTLNNVMCALLFDLLGILDTYLARFLKNGVCLMLRFYFPVFGILVLEYFFGQKLNVCFHSDEGWWTENTSV